ncbi:hypothetical protein BKA65DRAFT_23239 [Rhexocercosporidium sp. MPI-PUGE-AT-0058]|nr:hypothetical protein BKA65DRAFT_23239 [Rhexocercosporidium sp. MPI-PUGE-AT-0058]
MLCWTHLHVSQCTRLDFRCRRSRQCPERLECLMGGWIVVGVGEAVSNRGIGSGCRLPVLWLGWVGSTGARRASGSSSTDQRSQRKPCFICPLRTITISLHCGRSEMSKSSIDGGGLLSGGWVGGGKWRLKLQCHRRGEEKNRRKGSGAWRVENGEWRRANGEWPEQRTRKESRDRVMGGGDGVVMALALVLTGETDGWVPCACPGGDVVMGLVLL